MYPAHLFALFPPFPREVVVAMSFDPRFDPRWQNVIAPAIGSVLIDEKPLEPVRVDVRKISDSILTEILSGISHSRLVFADITTIGYFDERPIRNGNVMYEVGLAQAVRLPEEVLLFRSDNDSLLFDTANIRVNTYSPEDAPEKARAQVADTILDAGRREIDLRKHLAVKKAAESLDDPSWWVLAQSQSDGGVPHPQMRTMGQVVGNAASPRTEEDPMTEDQNGADRSNSEGRRRQLPACPRRDRAADHHGRRRGDADRRRQA